MQQYLLSAVLSGDDTRLPGGEVSLAQIGRNVASVLESFKTITAFIAIGVETAGALLVAYGAAENILRLNSRKSLTGELFQENANKSGYGSAYGSYWDWNSSWLPT